jgi:hypothetical protein
MRFSPGLLRAGALTVLAWSTSACNTMLGMEDVALGCYVAPDYPRIEPGTSTSLKHRQNNNPELIFMLDPQTPSGSSGAKAELDIWLADNAGQHTVLNTPGTYQLTKEDAQPSCGICVVISISFNTPTSTVSQELRAFGQGSLTLTTASYNRLAGSMHDLTFRQVITTGGIATDVEDGCAVAIHDLEFDMPYDTRAAR